MMDKVDVEATVRNGGPTGQAGCIRWGIAWALRSFLEKEMVEKMRMGMIIIKPYLLDFVNGSSKN